MSHLRGLALALAIVTLSGCASFVAPPYTADYEALDRLKKIAVQSVAVEKVQPRDASAPVNKITLRGAPLMASQGTFAQYLEEALIQDLREIRAFDPDSALRIAATVLKNDIDVSGISTGSGTMEVELAVSRGASSIYRKVYRASTSFESSFAGAVAIPKGQLEYSRLVRTLLSQVYSDIEFIQAIKK